MPEIGAFDENASLGSLLDRLQRGEEIVITRHGKRVARLVPESTARDREAARAAAERIRARVRAVQRDEMISVEEWKVFRDEGRG